MPSQKARSWKFQILAGIGLVVCLSVPIVTFFLSALAGLLIGPVCIWRATWTTPSSQELAGTYLPVNERAGTGSKSRLSLHEDGQVEIQNLPNFKDSNYAFDCVFNGTGRWHSVQSGGVIELTIDFDTARPSTHAGKVCPTSFNLNEIQLQGHSRPYTLYFYAGDPDEWTGLRLKQQ